MTTVGGYPITRIRLTVKSLANQGYKIWYWPVGGSAYDCPVEPLTQEFWQEQRRARLAYGILLPAVDVRDRGDLLILVTQSMENATEKGFSGLTVPQRYELYDLILEIGFTHVKGMDLMPPTLRIDFFKKFEHIFAEGIMPKKNEKGEYYRDLSEPGDAKVLQPDDNGRVECTKCKQNVALGDGLHLMDSYPVNDGSILAFAVCENCEEVLGLNFKNSSSFYKRVHKN